MIYPSAVDPAGIVMLKTVRKVFDIIGLKPEDIKFKKEQFTSQNLVDALTKPPQKCPVLVTLDLNDAPYFSPHVMIATGSRRVPIDANIEVDMIQCKNSYRDDIDERMIYIPLFGCIPPPPVFKSATSNHSDAVALYKERT